MLPEDAGIQDAFRHLANDQARTEAIAAEARDAFVQGRKVLVLSERTEHLDAIEAALGGLEHAPFVLHGRMSRKQRAALVAGLDSLPTDAPRVFLAIKADTKVSEADSSALELERAVRPQSPRQHGGKY